jgi:hypothetical protein
MAAHIAGKYSMYQGCLPHLVLKERCYESLGIEAITDNVFAALLKEN